MNRSISGIKYYSFGGTSGYGQAAQVYIAALLSLGYEVSWQPLCWRGNKYVPIQREEMEAWRDNETVLPPELAPLILKDIEYSHIIMHIVPEYWSNLKENDKINIGYTTWEADELPKHWPRLLNLVDCILVPSEFNRKVFQTELPNTPVVTLPHVINQHAASSDDVINAFQKKYKIDTNDKVFYTINTWTVRKNMAALLHAYLLSFDSNDAVCLIIKTSNHGTRSRLSNSFEPVADLVADVLANYTNSAKLVLIDDEEISDTEINTLHDIGDCYVSLSHGEGWGMGAAEAVSAGNPVLITGWSGHLDYLSDDYPGLINYQLTPVIDKLGAPSCLPHQNWAKADINDAIEKMISFTQESAEWKKAAVQHRNKLERFSFAAVGQQLDHILQTTTKNSLSREHNT